MKLIYGNMASRFHSPGVDPMQNLRTTAIPFALLALLMGCSHSLSRDEAKRIIEQHPLIRTADAVTVDAISSTNDAEAIVRTAIAGSTTNLKFRRFDTGWTWEFVETRAGGWIAPDVAIAQVREEQRTIAAAEWAKQHSDEYMATARKMYYIGLYRVPNPVGFARPDLLENAKRASINMLKARLARGDKDKEWDAEGRLAVLIMDRWTDVWGTELQTEFNVKDNSTLLVSLGADKTRNTGDDLLCLFTFTPGLEDGRRVWVSHSSWTVPEGLSTAVDPYFDKEDDRIEFSQAVKP